MSIYTDFAGKVLAGRGGRLCSISDKIWDLAETRFEERRSAKLLADELEREGFEIRWGVGSLPTAFRASFGSGRPVIGFLGEYDALPGLCQTAFSPVKAVPTDGIGSAGHGCGHHLLGTALAGAAIALKDFLAQRAGEGTAVFYGCPAEEGGSGKVWMLRAGVFDEADVLFTWHPDCMNRVSPNDVLAAVQIRYAFHGAAAHAASAPHMGKSALEAVELMGVGLGFLREHLSGDVRVHYAIDDSGGSATNIIQPEASVLYQIRAPRMSEVRDVVRRVDRLAEGAAIMTGVTYERRVHHATADLRVSETVNDVLHRAFLEVGGPVPDESDLELARALYGTIPAESRGGTAANAADFYGAEGELIARAMADTPLLGMVYPRRAYVRRYGASTDAGDVSQIKPTGFLNVACFVKDMPLHSWQAVSFGKTHFAHEGMLTAARVLAAAAMELCDSPELVEKAADEQREKAESAPYRSALPEDAVPPVCL